VLTTETTEIKGLQTNMHDSSDQHDAVDVTPTSDLREPFSNYNEPLQLPPQEVPWFQEHKRRRTVLPGEALDFQPTHTHTHRAVPEEQHQQQMAILDAHDADDFERGDGPTGSSGGTGDTGGSGYRPAHTAGKLLSNKSEAVRSRFHSGLDLLRTGGDKNPAQKSWQGQGQRKGQGQSEREGIHPFNGWPTVYDV
jgi:hypothetical protein